MQILLRAWEGELYVWKDAEFNKERYSVNGLDVRQTNILAIKDGIGGKYVRCKWCGETIKNNPEAIEKHFVEQEAKRDCARCENVRITNRKGFQRTITKGSNGKYNIVETYEAHMQCMQSWDDVASENSNQMCVHNQHRKLGVEPVGGLLMDHPDLFEKQITVEAIKAKGYQYLFRSGGFFVYDMGLRNTMWAYVNEYGIVDHFVASYRNRNRTFYYSATQKKLFHEASNVYKEGAPFNWSDNKYDMVRRKIEALYKEDKKK